MLENFKSGGFWLAEAFIVYQLENKSKSDSNNTCLIKLYTISLAVNDS